MPYFGLGLHLLVALFFAVHAIRSGQQLFWLFILFSFPVLGSVAYFLAVYLADSRLEHVARKSVTAAARSLDPNRELREAHAAFAYTPTAQNQMRLADALLEAGEADEAATNYEACLKGPFAADKEIKFRAARAFVESGRHVRAVEHLETVRSDAPNFRAEQVSLLLARALAGAGRSSEAKAEFKAANQRFGSFEAKVEYAVWAITSGNTELAGKLQAEIEHAMHHWNRHTHELNKPLVMRLKTAEEITNRQT